MKNIKEQLEEVIKKNLPEKKCEFEPDGEFHSCYNGCEGTVQNCRKCHRDICSNKLCPNGKADTLYPYGFNQALSQIDTSLIADEVLKVVVETYREAINFAIDEINMDATYLIRDGAREGILKLVDYKLRLSRDKENKNNETK